jgi:hypothetical protein
MKENKNLPSVLSETVTTSNIYHAAYLLTQGSSVDYVEVVKELDQYKCIMTLVGSSLNAHLEAYLNHTALVDPCLYQKAITRIKDIVFKAVSRNGKEGSL